MPVFAYFVDFIHGCGMWLIKSIHLPLVFLIYQLVKRWIRWHEAFLFPSWCLLAQHSLEAVKIFLNKAMLFSPACHHDGPRTTGQELYSNCLKSSRRRPLCINLSEFPTSRERRNVEGNSLMGKVVSVRLNEGSHFRHHYQLKICY